MSELAQHVHIRGGRALRGEIRVPGDLEVAQSVLLFAALGDGRSQLRNAPSSATLDAILRALRALGVTCDQTDATIHVDGVGLQGLRMPSGALECDRSLFALGLFAGLLSGQHFGTRITVHPSLAQCSVEHVVGPLRARGAQIAARAQGDSRTPPIAVAPLLEGERLRGIDASLPWSDPVAKSALLVSALFAAAPTTLSEPSVSADHTERMMVALGLPLRRVGTIIAFDPDAWDRRVPAFTDLVLPGSPTIAAFLAVAAHLLPGSDIVLRGVGINETRSGALDILRQWGGALVMRPRQDAALREPVADLRVGSCSVRGGLVSGELLVRARGEVAAIALLGAVARRKVLLCELGWVGPDREASWPQLSALLDAFGLAASLRGSELEVGTATAAAGGLRAGRSAPGALCLRARVGESW